MIQILLGLVVVAAAGVVAALVYMARDQRISVRGVGVLTVLCAGALLIMILTDWPSEMLAKFWADHSVLAGLLSTVLLVAVAFLAFEDAERRQQERLDATVTSAGLGGIVDHVVDVEVALAMLSAITEPSRVDWPGWGDEAGKPLRWLRHDRDRLSRSSGGPRQTDPRVLRPSLPKSDVAQAWRAHLIDQCVRRLLAAIRDWGPVIQTSRNGTVMLIALSDLRRDLMRLSSLIERGETNEAERLLSDVRVRCRTLAHLFETLSGADPLRPEVLSSFSPLPATVSRAWTLDAKGRRTLGSEWRQALSQTVDALSGRSA